MRSLESQIEEEQKGRQDATKNARKYGELLICNAVLTAIVSSGSKGK